MKLPLSFHATFRMKEFYHFKAEMYLGAVLRRASAQEATTQDIRHEYRRDFIKFFFRLTSLINQVTSIVQLKLLPTMVYIIFLMTLRS